MTIIVITVIITDFKLTKNIKVKVIKENKLFENVKELIFKVDENFKFNPGQFVTLIANINGEIIKRAYSISSKSNLKDEFHLCIKKVENGKMTTFLFQESQLGKEFEIVGPFGLHNLSKFIYKKIILVCVGIGIAPVKSIIESLISNKDIEIVLVYGNQFDDKIIYKKLFDKLDVENSNFNLRYVISRTENSKYNKGYVQENIDDINFNNTDVFICGMIKMVNSVKDKIMEKKAKNCQIFEEKFG
jgi:NAD(P)H-flavin reductase